MIDVWLNRGYVPSSITFLLSVSADAMRSCTTAVRFSSSAIAFIDSLSGISQPSFITPILPWPQTRPTRRSRPAHYRFTIDRIPWFRGFFSISTSEKMSDCQIFRLYKYVCRKMIYDRIKIKAQPTSSYIRAMPISVGTNVLVSINC